MPVLTQLVLLVLQLILTHLATCKRAVLGVVNGAIGGVEAKLNKRINGYVHGMCMHGIRMHGIRTHGMCMHDIRMHGMCAWHTHAWHVHAWRVHGPSSACAWTGA